MGMVGANFALNTNNRDIKLNVCHVHCTFWHIQDMTAHALGITIPKNYGWTNPRPYAYTSDKSPDKLIYQRPYISIQELSFIFDKPIQRAENLGCIHCTCGYCVTNNMNKQRRAANPKSHQDSLRLKSLPKMSCRSFWRNLHPRI